MDKKTIIAVVIAVVLVGVLIGGSLVSGLFTSTNKTQDTTMQQEPQVQSKDILVGTGDIAVAGKEVTVNYTGVFADGKKFDSSLDRGVPFTFTLGTGLVIKGWDIGVEGMKVGGKRIIVVPPQLGYGDKDYNSIPGNSTLIFEIELLGVK
ncbi:MAG: FKBP-type peptidyl-prolyl cis-trans isomerase [bacterium]